MNQKELQEWAKVTCHAICTASDLKSICRARGFAPLKNAKKDALAEYVEMRLLGEQGVSEVLATLEEKPLWALHALVAAGEPVDIEELYSCFGFEEGRYWIAPGEHKRRFERIRDDLVSKGLALMHPMYAWERKGSRYAEMRVCVPKVVAKRLPPLPLSTEAPPEAPTFSDWITITLEGIRHSLIPARKSRKGTQKSFPGGVLKQGVLHIEGLERPGLRAVHDMILQRWLGIDKSKAIRQRRHLLGAIPAGRAIRPKLLLSAFNRFNCGLAAAKFEDFVEFGVRFGLLAQLDINGENCLVPNIGLPDNPHDLLPDFSVLTDAGECVTLSLDELGLAELLLLASISTFKIDHSMLCATPSIIAIGQQIEALRKSPWVKVLLKKSRIYGKAFKTVEKRVGKVLVHSGVTVLKFGGPDITAQMKHKYMDRMVPLGNDHYAISRNDLAEMVHFAKQKGFSPKTLIVKESPES